MKRAKTVADTLGVIGRSGGIQDQNTVDRFGRPFTGHDREAETVSVPFGMADDQIIRGEGDKEGVIQIPWGIDGEGSRAGLCVEGGTGIVGPRAFCLGIESGEEIGCCFGRIGGDRQGEGEIGIAGDAAFLASEPVHPGAEGDGVLGDGIGCVEFDDQQGLSFVAVADQFAAQFVAMRERPLDGAGFETGWKFPGDACGETAVTAVGPIGMPMGCHLEEDTDALGGTGADAVEFADEFCFDLAVAFEEVECADRLCREQAGEESEGKGEEAERVHRDVSRWVRCSVGWEWEGAACW